MRKSTRRGRLATLRRSLSLLSRYGLGPARLLRKIEGFRALVPKPTFAVPAAVLKRSPDLLPPGVELAIHGLHHLDYSGLPAEAQEAGLREALRIFKEAGRANPGFRAPYLRTNEDTLRVLRALEFPYDSSCTILWDLLPAGRINSLYKMAIELYAPRDARRDHSLPFSEDGLLRIPVSLPDDEMLIDRLGMRDPREIFSVWVEILEECRRKDEVFVLLCHPERFHLAGPALAALRERADSLGMWTADLGEISRRWRAKEGEARWPEGKRGALCVTGDIDRLSLSGLLREVLGL